MLVRRTMPARVVICCQAIAVIETKPTCTMGALF